MRFRSLVLFCVFAFLAVTTQAQNEDSLTNRQQRIFQYLKDSCDNRLGLACGWGGAPTDNTYYIKALITYKRFDLIEQLLDSEIPATVYLAAQTLVLAEKKKLYILSDPTQKRINRLRHSHIKVSFCSGCFVGYTYSIGSLLKRFQPPKFAFAIKKYLKECLQENL